MEILDAYVTSVPTLQNAVDIFQGEWASQFPRQFAKIEAGKIPLFEDTRLEWGIKKLGGAQERTVLELGPLEGGHSYMLEKMGASSIVSVEANTRCYLKCLIVKETMQLKRCRFLCGDFVQYLKTNPGKFDLCCASGVLYHMTNPVELLAKIAEVTDRIFIWTHYYDRDCLEKNPHQIAHKFPSSKSAQYEGFKHNLYRYEYKTALDFAGFCGGSQPFSYWMSRQDILECLNHFGFNEINIGFDDLEHPNGPSFALAAIRR